MISARRTQNYRIGSVFVLPENFHFVTEFDGVGACSACVVIYTRAVGVKLKFGFYSVDGERVRFDFLFFHPEGGMPEFVAFDKFCSVAVFRVHERNFHVRPVCVGKRRHDVGIDSVRCPFRMVKRVACGRLDGLYEFPCAVCDKEALVRVVTASDELDAGFPDEVEECGALAAILCERCVAGLCAVVPNCICCVLRERGTGFGDAGAKQFCTCDSERVVFADAAVEGPVEEFLRSPELSVCEWHLPSRRGKECGFVLVVAGVCHIDDYGVSVFKNPPARNSG